MQDAILYQNVTRSVTLLDIPRSLEQGQDTLARLISSPPVETPYQSTEPKGSKRRKLINSTPTEELTYHNCIQELVAAALADVKANYAQEDWCLPRTYALGSQPDSPLATAASFLEDHLANQEEFLTKCTKDDLNLSPEPPAILSPVEVKFARTSDLLNIIVCNPHTGPVILSVASNTFCIPPQSVFFCSTVTRGLASIYRSIGLLLPKQPSETADKTFDLILFDPPWSNRSVRRGKFYATAESQVKEPFDQAFPVIRDLLSNLGVVAIWITNKTAVRMRVIKALANIGLQLHEEWVWAKVTTHGEPVTVLDGIWRKPYEILLLFRRSLGNLTSVQRRVIVAVPDIHSRKPCLKILLEPYLPSPYNAMEVFARNLTAGWWSWGDEVLKYQYESHWAAAT